MDNNPLKTPAQLKPLIDHELRRFLLTKAELATSVSHSLQALAQGWESFVLAGGKRLRPALVYYGYRAAGGTGEAEILQASIFIELVHAYLLIHDDVMDRDSLRRGVPTLRRTYQSLYEATAPEAASHAGDSLAIVAGDLLCGWGYEILSESAFPDKERLLAVRALNRLIQDVTLGQALDVQYPLLANTPEAQDLLKVAEYKTARYSVEGPLRIGLLLAGASEELVAGISRYAIPLGIAFQLHDDILGLFGEPDETGKAVGSDLRENKQTLLTVKALEMAAPALKKELSLLLGRSVLTAAEVARGQAIVRESGALAFVEDMERRLVADARLALSAMDLEPQVKEALNDLAFYLIARKA